MQALIEQPAVEIDRAALIREEVERVEAIYKSGSTPMALAPNFASVQDFVEYVFDKHEGMIRQWGGWHFLAVGAPRKRVSAATIRATWREAEQWARGAVYRDQNKKMPRLRRFVPFATRIWEKADMEYEFAPGCVFKLRKGSVTSRTVLRDVERVYGQNTVMWYTWSRFFERMGQHWAGVGDPASLPSLMLTCAPSVFLELGHLGESSCYSNQGQHRQAKLNLAQFPNSFVGLAFKTKAQRDEMLALKLGKEPERVITAEDEKKLTEYVKAGYTRANAELLLFGRPQKGWDKHRQNIAKLVAGRFWGVFGGPGALVTNFYRIQWETYSDQIMDTISRQMGAVVKDTMVKDTPARIGADDGFRIILKDHPMALFHGGPIEGLGAHPRWVFIDMKGRILAPLGEDDAVVQALRLVTGDVVAPGHKLFKRPGG